MRSSRPCDNGYKWYRTTVPSASDGLFGLRGNRTSSRFMLGSSGVQSSVVPVCSRIRAWGVCSDVTCPSSGSGQVYSSIQGRLAPVIYYAALTATTQWWMRTEERRRKWSAVPEAGWTSSTGPSSQWKLCGKSTWGPRRSCSLELKRGAAAGVAGEERREKHPRGAPMLMDKCWRWCSPGCIIGHRGVHEKDPCLSPCGVEMLKEKLQSHVDCHPLSALPTRQPAGVCDKLQVVHDHRCQGDVLKTWVHLGASWSGRRGTCCRVLKPSWSLWKDDIHPRPSVQVGDWVEGAQGGNMTWMNHLRRGKWDLACV